MNGSSAGRARKLRRTATVARVTALVIASLAAAFLALFVVTVVMGDPAWLVLPSVAIMLASAFQLSVSARSFDQFAVMYEHSATYDALRARAARLLTADPGLSRLDRLDGLGDRHE